MYLERNDLPLKENNLCSCCLDNACMEIINIVISRLGKPYCYPFTPRSDQNVISPCIINTLSTRQVKTIKKIIN